MKRVKQSTTAGASGLRLARRMGDRVGESETRTFDEEDGDRGDHGWDSHEVSEDWLVYFWQPEIIDTFNISIKYDLRSIHRSDEAGLSVGLLDSTLEPT